ncbi:MAG TPA: hypothetical protein VH684_13955 [Xanthobacteraceae bacterium]|jgi:hypothetical protein
MKPFRILGVLLSGAAGAWWLLAGPSVSQTPELLQLEAKIPLGQVGGRIDHMAVDLGRQRLLVAELGNNSVGIVDLKERKLFRRLAGLSEPQGVAHVPSTDAVYVANGGDGSVRLFGGDDYRPDGRIKLADDADNVRLDVKANRILVGYGSGGLALIDPASGSKVADIRLKAHPESFQIDSASGRIFVNVPRAREIAVVDAGAGKQTASWPMNNGSHFPMALDESTQRVLVVFRNPATLGVFAMSDGAAVARVGACGDADDLWIDAKRQRVYISCGQGFVDVFDGSNAAYRRIAHVPTAAGARTSFFVPELDRLFLAARASSGEPASIWILRPAP